jgi:hypothetical protein
MPYPTVYEPIATNKTDVTLQATDHPDHHNQLARILNMLQQQHVPDVARANLLTNGGFEIWQRGNGPFTVGGAHTADRWRIILGASSTISVTRDTANAEVGSNACAAVTYTHAAASYVWQKNEDYLQLRGRTVSLSARVRCNAANAVRIYVSDGGAGVQYSTYHTGDNTWQTLTVTAFVVPAGAISVDVGFNFAASCTAYLDNAMLVIGSVAADYAPLHPADDLARCLRYYEVMGQPGGNDFVFSGYATGASGTWFFPATFKVQKPVVPTVTKVGTWGVTNCGQPGVAAPTGYGFQLFIGSVASGLMFTQNNSAGTCFTVEGNP